jgi:hypothetical protein
MYPRPLSRHFQFAITPTLAHAVPTSAANWRPKPAFLASSFDTRSSSTIELWIDPFMSPQRPLRAQPIIELRLFPVVLFHTYCAGARLSSPFFWVSLIMVTAQLTACPSSDHDHMPPHRTPKSFQHSTDRQLPLTLSNPSYSQWNPSSLSYYRSSFFSKTISSGAWYLLPHLRILTSFPTSTLLLHYTGSLRLAERIAVQTVGRSLTPPYQVSFSLVASTTSFYWLSKASLPAPL